MKKKADWLTKAKKHRAKGKDKGIVDMMMLGISNICSLMLAFLNSLMLAFDAGFSKLSSTFPC